MTEINYNPNNPKLREIDTAPKVENQEPRVDTDQEVKDAENLSEIQMSAVDDLANYFRNSDRLSHIADTIEIAARSCFTAINLTNRIRTLFPGTPLRYHSRDDYKTLTGKVVSLKDSHDFDAVLIDAANQFKNENHSKRMQTAQSLVEFKAKYKDDPAKLERMTAGVILLENQYRDVSNTYQALVDFLQNPIQF